MSAAVLENGGGGRKLSDWGQVSRGVPALSREGRLAPEERGLRNVGVSYSLKQATESEFV